MSNYQQPYQRSPIYEKPIQFFLEEPEFSLYTKTNSFTCKHAKLHGELEFMHWTMSIISYDDDDRLNVTILPLTSAGFTNSLYQLLNFPINHISELNQIIYFYLLYEQSHVSSIIITWRISHNFLIPPSNYQQPYNALIYQKPTQFFLENSSLHFIQKQTNLHANIPCYMESQNPCTEALTTSRMSYDDDHGRLHIMLSS